MSEWTLALDALERQLQRQELALRGSGDVPNGVLFQAPGSAMTSAEQVRALALMQRNDTLLTDTLAMMRRGRRETATPYSA